MKTEKEKAYNEVGTKELSDVNIDRYSQHIKEVHCMNNPFKHKIELKNYSGFTKNEKKYILIEYIDEIIDILTQKDIDISIERYNQKLNIEQINDTLEFVKEELNKFTPISPCRYFALR